MPPGRGLVLVRQPIVRVTSIKEFLLHNMNIPKFRRTRSFLDGLEVPCLKATMPHSTVPKLAAKRIEEDPDEPDCKIYLRAEDPAQITSWQQEMLERLFTREELPKAIEQGMQEFISELDPDDLEEEEEEAMAIVKKDGVLPLLGLRAVVIDDMKREVILRLVTDSFVHLEEHGIIIYLKENAWKFDPDHIYDYLGGVEDEEAKRGPVDFEVEEEDEE